MNHPVVWIIVFLCVVFAAITLVVYIENSSTSGIEFVYQQEELPMTEPKVQISMALAKELIDDCRELAEASQSTGCRKAYYDQVVQLEVAVRLAQELSLVRPDNG